MPKPWYYRLPQLVLALALVALLWAWQSPTASGLERFWLGLMGISTSFGVWGLARALQTRRWVGREQARHPDLDYTAAISVAQTHIVTHASTLITTVALLVFGAAVALTMPARPGGAPSRNTYVLTAAMLAIGVTKTFLNVYLVYKRDRLVRVVQEIGGD